MRISSPEVRVYNGSVFIVQSSTPTESVTAVINNVYFINSVGGGDLTIGQNESGDTITLYEPTSTLKVLMHRKTFTIVLGDGGSFTGNITAERGCTVTSMTNGNSMMYETTFYRRQSPSRE